MRVAARCPEGNAVAKPIAADREALATLESSIREPGPGKAEDPGRMKAESDVQRTGAAVLEGMPAPRFQLERATTGR